MNGHTVYLVDVNTQQAVDSSLIAESKFSFTGSVEKPLVRRIQLGRLTGDILLDNSTTAEITLSRPCVVKDNGGYNDKLNGIFEEVNAGFMNARKLYEELMASGADRDSVAMVINEKHNQVYTLFHKAMSEIGVAPHDIAVISGIGCSSRLPYYMNTYGFHTIHGRAAAIATGAKVANPNLTVWQISGDGDGLAIGGNHFIHAVRRNIDLNMILLNNRIYGLTKGQYSPTSKRGFVSKSSPYGTVEDPFRPAELCFGARGNFFARCVATDMNAAVECLKAAAQHKGAAVTEVLQNCVIFNNGTHESIYTKEGRAKNAIYLEHGKPMVFGENREYGLMQEGFGLKVVKIGENGITENDILVHDAHCKDTTLHLKLALMEGPDFPIALGVIRDVEAITYNDAVHAQIEEVKQSKRYHTFSELLETNETWEIK